MCSIINCYSASEIIVLDHNGGGLIGADKKGRYSGCFWDFTINPLLNDAGNGDKLGIFGQTTINMQKTTTFTDQGWDFVNETENGTEDIWYIYENQSYPRLRWQNHIPVADAGPDRIAYADPNALACITLDASVSYDADNDPLTYYWSWILNGQPYTSNGADGLINLHDFTQLALRPNLNTQTLSQFWAACLQNSTQSAYNPLYDLAPAGPILTLDLPLGTHTITLTVSDSIDNSPPDTVTVTIYQSGDLDHNGSVNQTDLNPILNARNTPAADPKDPRDLNHDGHIDILDARLFVIRYLN